MHVDEGISLAVDQQSWQLFITLKLLYRVCPPPPGIGAEQTGKQFLHGSVGTKGKIKRAADAEKSSRQG